jgi:hypothetical protein
LEFDHGFEVYLDDYARKKNFAESIVLWDVTNVKLNIITGIGDDVVKVKLISAVNAVETRVLL